MVNISFVDKKEIDRIINAVTDKNSRLDILADICRLNALSAVKKAGSGHLGSSFSAMEIMVAMYFSELNLTQAGLKNKDRDIYFSSKGHDCPGHYSVLMAAGILPFEKLINLRRLGGLDGHPDVAIPGMEANTGSLGMGISKAKGMAIAKKMKGSGGRIFVMLGDGELQEGQIWESLQTTVAQKVSNITAIVDFNKIQTDRPIVANVDLGDLESKFRIFGWHAERCNGHDFAQLQEAFEKLKQIVNKPKVLIADTVKGEGVSFMEGGEIVKTGCGTYKWHSGAPQDDDYTRAFSEILDRINKKLSGFGSAQLELKDVEKRESRVHLKDIAEKVVNTYADTLVRLGAERKDIVVLDADLACDCGLRPFEQAYPDRFIEHGIAEQDMVSTAGGLAKQGFLPIVNSFGVFLSSRSNEQIYNNATELTKIIYVCHYSGMIPAGPGKSHQSVRDISLFGALPNMVIVEPVNAVETKATLEWCVKFAKENCMIRLIISPSPQTISLPQNYEFIFGRGSVIREGNDAVIFAYGPVMANEALKAGDELAKREFSLKIINMPWLNRVDIGWFESVIGDCAAIYVLDDHFIYGGLGDSLLNAINCSKALKQKKFKKFGIENEYPACGTPKEVLSYHKLDGESLAARILKDK